MKKNKTVLVSFSGGIKSLVAAYILKKQGDQVTGALIQIPSLDGESYSMRSSCHQNDEEIVQKYCDLLEIPLVKIDGKDYYKQFVIDRLVAAKLSGEALIPCVYCNQVRMDLLAQKADELKINFVATGHLAQVSKSLTTNSFYLSQALDLENDQSFFLTGLTNVYLERLQLPLGTLALAEIVKIAKSLLGKKAEGTAPKICLMDEAFLPSYIESHTPESLRPRGSLIEYFEDLPLGEHDGIYRYKLGQKDIRCTFNEVDPSYEIVSMDPNKNEIKVARNWKHEQKILILKKFESYTELDVSKPIHTQVALDPFAKEKLPGILYFSNNGMAYFELKKPITSALERGAPLVFYIRSKIIGHALVEESYKDAPPITDTFRL